MPLTLANATLATLAPPRLVRAHLTVDAGHISSITDESTPEAGDVLDCAGKLILPGNVCAHTHLYSALARGMPAPPKSPTNFPEILEYVWWRLDRALDESSIRSSGLVGVLDAVRCGTTTLVDHHASPGWIDGSLDVLADAFDSVGARGVLCYEVTDRGGSERRDAGLRENERFITTNRRERLAGMIGAHASFTLQDGTLEALSGMAADLHAGIHIHVAEDICDELDSLRRSGKRTAIRLRDFNIFDDSSIAAHGVHLDQHELAAIHEKHTWLVHNCRSNMNNRVGRAPIDVFGPRAALGTDGIDGDLFAESRTAFFRAREESLDADAARYASMLSAGAALASQHFSAPLGALEVGAAADLILLDYDSPTPLTEGNLAWHWVFGMHAGLVHSVMIDGRWIIRNHEFVSLDEEKIRADARVEAQKLWQRMQAL